MPFDATIFPILIAGPSDVGAELDEVMMAMNAWNERHGGQVGVRMEPRTWRRHSSPEMGGDPQEILNRQIGDQCDAVIAVFGARMGTPTPRAISGTVEEIERFQAAGKRVMVYFSSGDIPREGFSAEQFQELEGFKRTLRARGLLGEYSSPQDLRQQIDAHLSDLGYRFRDSLQSAQDRPRLTPVRSALNLEIAANQRLLQRLWDEINRPAVPLDPPIASPELLPALRLTQQDPPRWRRSVFEQQLPSILEALDPAETERVDLFYDQLTQFDAQRGVLRPFMSAADRYNFPPAGIRAWQEIQRVAEAILREGHPLGKVIDDPPNATGEGDETLGYLDYRVAQDEALAAIAASNERLVRLRNDILERINKLPRLQVSDDAGFEVRRLAHLSVIADVILTFTRALVAELDSGNEAWRRLEVAARGVLANWPFGNVASLNQAWGDAAWIGTAREMIDEGIASAQAQQGAFARIEGAKGASQALDRAMKQWDDTFEMVARSHEAKRPIVEALEIAYTERLAGIAES